VLFGPWSTNRRRAPPSAANGCPITVVRILHLEDDHRDAQLVQETLDAGGIDCDLTRVEDAAEYAVALEQGEFDLILADYTLPSFDGLSALAMAREKCADVPFIFVSGTLGEEVAIEAIKKGATDYVFKTRLTKIVHSAQRALREARERAELTRIQEALRRSEAYLAEAQRISRTGSFGWNPSTGRAIWSLESFRIFGYPPAAAVTTEQILERVHPEDRIAVGQLIERISRERRAFEFEHRLLLPDNSVKHVRVIGHPSADAAQNFEFVGAVMDITDRRQAEEIRVSERTRIARDLHDTLLQSFQGLMLLLHAASDMLPERPVESSALLERALGRAEQAIAEGRDAVSELRFPATVDVLQAMNTLAQDLTATERANGYSSPAVQVFAEGDPQVLQPMVRYETCRIAAEALRNAFRHAQARRIDIAIIYRDADLQVRVCDDGRGIDAALLADGGRAGHWGLAGMRERAKRIGAQLTVRRRADAGTEVELNVPLRA
jgi:PAS domain S-box-containing protein